MEITILHMEVILQQKFDESNVLCYFYNFDPFWGKKEPKLPICH